MKLTSKLFWYKVTTSFKLCSVDVKCYEFDKDELILVANITNDSGNVVIFKIPQLFRNPEVENIIMFRWEKDIAKNYMEYHSRSSKYNCKEVCYLINNNKWK